ncbi:MAG: hypothetical protein ABI402_01700 [Ferruginibacter sp.]
MSLENPYSYIYSIMTYTFDNANKILETYKYLEGKELIEGMVITDIVITPSNDKLLQSFLTQFEFENAKKSLKLAGFNKDSVRIILLSKEDPFIAGGAMLELDAYLTDNNIEKVYDSEGVFIEPKSI